MFNIGGGEFVLILLVALVVLGPTKLPEAARQVGKIMGEFRRVSAGFQREMQAAMNDPISKVTGEPTPKTLSDVTKVASLPAVEEPKPAEPTPSVEAAKPAEPSSPTPPATPGNSGGDVTPPEEPPEAPMYSDR